MLHWTDLGSQKRHGGLVLCQLLSDCQIFNTDTRHPPSQIVFVKAQELTILWVVVKMLLQFGVSRFHFGNI